MKKSDVQTLREMKVGQTGIVIRFTGDCNSRERLASMGIMLGCRVKLLLKNSGRYLVAIHESRIAVGPELAQDILLTVEEVDDAFAQAVARLKQIWEH